MGILLGRPFYLKNSPTKYPEGPDVFSENRKNGLTRYRVPLERKARLREELAALGVTGRTLFPDLGGLAGTLESEYERKWRNLRRSTVEDDAS